MFERDTYIFTRPGNGSFVEPGKSWDELLHNLHAFLTIQNPATWSRLQLLTNGPIANLVGVVGEMGAGATSETPVIT